MGILSAKCPQCWDSIPCGCAEQGERDRSARDQEAYRQTTAVQETNRLLREQNELLRRIANLKGPKIRARD